ncbi:MAG: hypothetical protein AAEJ43_08600, partial [Gammaproteobacteria bacterium]
GRSFGGTRREKLEAQVAGHLLGPHISPAFVARWFKGAAWLAFATEERAGVVDLGRAFRSSERPSGRAIGPPQ